MTLCMYEFQQGYKKKYGEMLGIWNMNQMALRSSFSPRILPTYPYLLSDLIDTWRILFYYFVGGRVNQFKHLMGFLA